MLAELDAALAELDAALAEDAAALAEVLASATIFTGAEIILKALPL